MSTVTAEHVIGDRGVIADVPTRLRAKRTNDPLAHVDLTTATGRRVRDLFNGYVAALGRPLSAIMAAQVARGPRLGLLNAEQMPQHQPTAGQAQQIPNIQFVRRR